MAGQFHHFWEKFCQLTARRCLHRVILFRLVCAQLSILHVLLRNHHRVPYSAYKNSASIPRWKTLGDRVAQCAGSLRNSQYSHLQQVDVHLTWTSRTRFSMANTQLRLTVPRSQAIFRPNPPASEATRSYTSKVRKPS